MLEKRRGYNAIYLPWGMPFPNNTQPAQGAIALTYDQLCAQLAAHGANTLRVKFVGWNEPMSVVGAQSFEPVLGQYNDWDGRLQELIAACLAHGIGIHAICFDRVEWMRSDAWYKHAWNPRNGGFLSEPNRVLVDAQAIDYARLRIDAIAEKVGSVICSWEVCAEMTYLFSTDFFSTNWTGLQRVVVEQGVPWVEAMAQHIHSVHDAPVGGGNVTDIGSPAEFKNELHRVPSLDFALMNMYGDQDVSVKFADLRAAQIYTGKPVYVEQYAPWAIGSYSNGTYVRDDDPFPRSKAHEWACACGEYGVTNPWRWPEAGTDVGPASTWWGIAHENHAEIAGVTRYLAETVDLERWSGRGCAFDLEIQSDGLSFVSSWGDGRHVTAYCDWFAGGPKRIVVSGLSGETCKVTGFDYLTGDPSVIQENVPILSGRISFELPTSDTRAAFYVEPPESPPPQIPHRSIRVRGVLEVEGEPGGTFEGVLEEVET